MRPATAFCAVLPLALPGGGGSGSCGGGRGSGLDMAEVKSTMEARANGALTASTQARFR
jgi:hypothetical protein